MVWFKLISYSAAVFLASACSFVHRSDLACIVFACRGVCVAFGKRIQYPTQVCPVSVSSLNALMKERISLSQ